MDDKNNQRKNKNKGLGITAKILAGLTGAVFVLVVGFGIFIGSKTSSYTEIVVAKEPVDSETENKTTPPEESQDIPVEKELSDAEGKEKAVDLDETGRSLMPEDFVFTPVEGKEENALAPGVHAEEVIALQERLMELDYMEEDEPTDYYGEQTAYALQLFQRKHGLSADGIAGSQTLELLMSENAMRYVVSVGLTGTDVEELQKRLTDLGYLKVAVTGYYGTDTQLAVKAFQKENGITPDGAVGSNTREALYSEDAKGINQPTPTATITISPTNQPTAKPTAKATEQPTAKPTAKATEQPTANPTAKPTAQPTAEPTKTPSPTKQEPGTDKKPDTSRVNKLISVAKSLLGKPYVWGAKGPDSFDCSGFVYYCLNQSGYQINYMTSAGWAGSSYPKVTNKADLEAGDIICYQGHVGIYLGNATMIDASSTDGKIRITSNIWNKSYWVSHYICGRRVLYK